MKRNNLARPRANSWLAQPIKRFLCAVAFPALLCASAALSLQAAPITLYYATPGVVNNPAPWNTSSTDWNTLLSGAGTSQGWVNGDYAYFGVTGVTVPEAITIDPLGIDTPGITLVNASSDFGLTQPTGSSITLNSDNAHHPGYCTIYLAQGRNLYLNTLLQGTKGLYITGDNTPINKNQCVLNAGANTYSGGTYINEEVTVQNTYGFGTGPITFAGGLLKANNTAGNFYFNFTNAVNIVADTPFGSANNWMVFSGPVNIQGTGKMLSVGNIDVTFSGVISGHDLNVINYTNATSTQNAIMILNGSSPNTYSGGTTVSFQPGPGPTGHSTLLDAQTAGSLGTGNVTVNAPSGGGLSCTLQMDSGLEMASTATLNVAIGATVNLTYGGTQTINALFVGGIQQAPGVFGASALNPSGVFTGTGTLTIVSGPPVRISSTTISANQLTVSWSSVAGGQYNVYTNNSVVSPLTWAIVNPSPIIAVGTTTSYTLPVSVTAQSPLFVKVQQ